MAWYEDWFGSDAYDLVYNHRDEDEAAQMVDLIESAADPAPRAHILDVACGRGRHARELARRGYRVTGVDLSEDAIAEARARAAADGLDVTFQVGDMREAVCQACADGVVNLFTAFGYFEDDTDNQAALDAMATALRPGGWLVQDFLNAPHVADTLVPEDTQTRNGITITQRRRIDDGRIRKRIDLDDGTRHATYRESVRLYTLTDLESMYDAAGLDIDTTYGDYSGAEYAPSAPRLILVAHKR
jgi:SAM-dependent methyltransferase